MSFDPASAVAALRIALTGAQPSVALIANQLEQMPVAVLVADDGERFIGANWPALDLTGYTRDALARLTIGAITPPGERSAQERLWRSFERCSEQRGDYMIQRKDGSIIRVRYHAFHDVAPGIHVSFLLPHEQAR